jgi:ribosome modulation factor
MWFLLALIGLAAASTAIESGKLSGRDDAGDSDGGQGGGAGGDSAADDPDEAGDRGELIDHAETGPRAGTNEPEAERDPWLDGWQEDEYLSTDADDPAPGDDPPPDDAEEPPPNEEGAERDPWLEGWTDDDLSTDADDPAPGDDPPVVPPRQPIRVGAGFAGARSGV